MNAAHKIMNHISEHRRSGGGSLIGAGDKACENDAGGWHGRVVRVIFAMMRTFQKACCVLDI